MDEFILSSTTLNDIQNHDDFLVVWLSTDHNFPEELTHFADYLEKFDSFEDCDNYIKEYKSERLILLVLANLSEYLSYFRNFRQIQAIYVLHTNIDCEKQIDSKLVNTFTNEGNLIDKLRQDILLTYRVDLPITISCLSDFKNEKSFLKFDKNTHTFLWNQLFVSCLVDDSDVDMNKLKTNMIEQCQIEYSNNPTQLNYIHEFDKTCTYDNVLAWYVADSFVHRLINQSLRTRNIDLIWKFRYFFILAYKKLKELSIEQQNKRTYSVVYRGQKIGKTDLECLRSNRGHLISVNTMLSTSRAKDIALGFLFGTPLGVLFEITIPNRSDNIFHPFADISQFGSKPHEEEILFYFGAVFRIDSVEKENDSIWIVKLTLSNESVEQIEQVIDGVKEQLDAITCWQHLFMKVENWILFGRYLRKLTGHSFSWGDLVSKKTGINLYHLLSSLGHFEQEVEYFEDLLNHGFIDEPKRLVIHIIIGYNYFNLFEFDKALLHYGVAYSLLDRDNKLRVNLYTHIGDVWTAQNNFKDASSYYKMALDIIKSQDWSTYDMSILYRKLSDACLQQNNYEEAIFYIEQADKIDANRRQRTEFDLEDSLTYLLNRYISGSKNSSLQEADTLYSIGICLLKKSKYSEALEKFLQAKDLYESHLPSSKRFLLNFSRVFLSIALAYLLLKDNFKALIMLKKAIDIRGSHQSD